MARFSLHEAKTQLSRLVDRAAAAGEEIVIAKGGRPLVCLVPLARAPTYLSDQRRDVAAAPRRTSPEGPGLGAGSRSYVGAFA